MIKKFITYAMLVMATVMGSAAIAAESADEVKLPELTGQAVFLTKENISKDEQQKIISALQNLEIQSKVQMAVLVVDSIKPLTIEDYSIKVAEKWKIGKAKEDNGLILVIATQDHKARIEVGYGMEGKITDAISSRILKDYVTPEFKKKNWYGGIMQAIGRIENVSQGKPLDAAVSPNISSATKAKDSSSGWRKVFHDADGDWLIILVVIFLFVGLFVTHIGHLILTGIVVGSIIHSIGKDISNILTSIVSAAIAGVFAYYVLHGAWYVSVISGAIFGAVGIKWFFELLGDIIGSSGGGGSGGGFSSSSSSSSSGGFSGGGGSFGGGGSSSDW